MTVTPTPAFVQTPKVWTAAINAGDVSKWKLLGDGISAAGAGANGSKISAIVGSSSDTVSRDVQLGIARQISATMTNATPGVGTFASGANIANGDQIVFEAGTIPPPLIAGTTYFVIAAVPSSQPGVAATFEVAATFGGSAIATTGTGTAVVVYVIRILTTIQMIALSGFTSIANAGAATASFLNAANLPGYPVDNDGNPYLFLESADFLAVSCTATITAGKIMNIAAIGGNF